MARQEGIITLRGKLGNQVFYVSNGKNLVKGAGAPYLQPESSRKSSSEFGRGNAAAVLINKGFKPLIDLVGSTRVIDRLKSILIKIVNTGPIELKGKRQVTDGDVALLKGFQFNRYTSMDRLITISPSIQVDPGGELTVSLPKMRVKDMFYPPPKTIAAVLQFRCCIFYFDLKNGRFVMPEDLVIPLTKATFPGGAFSLPIQDTGDCVLLLAWSIYFSPGDDLAPTMNRKYYAGSIIEAVNIVDGKVVSFQYPEPVVITRHAETTNKAQWKMNEEDH